MKEEMGDLSGSLEGSSLDVFEVLFHGGTSDLSPFIQ